MSEVEKTEKQKNAEKELATMIQKMQSQIDAHEEKNKNYLDSSEFKSFEEKLTKDFDDTKKDFNDKFTSLNDTIKQINLGSTAKENKAKIELDLFEKALRYEGLNRRGEKALAKRFEFSDGEVKQLNLYRSDVNDALGYFTGLPILMREVIDTNLREISPVMRLAKITRANKTSILRNIKTQHGKGRWVSESETMTRDQSIRIGQKQLQAHKVQASYGCTLELLADDDFNLLEDLRNDYLETFEQMFGEAFIKGDGINKPKGIFLESVIERIKSGNATKFTADGIIDLYYGVKTRYANRCTFGARRLAIRDLAKLKDNDGQYYLSNLRDGMGMMLYGQPLVEMPDMDLVAAGTEPLIFGDWKGYEILISTASELNRFLIDPFSKKYDGEIEYLYTRAIGGLLINAEGFVIQEIGT